jgi:alpha-methylacyl-CoA racemase
VAQSTRGPLAGLRVLDLTRLLPGGFCTLLLADLGADVVKVEDTGAGDYLRWSPPFYEGPAEGARSAHFIALNRNKRSIRIDLRNERGREVFLALVRDADVLVESFRPGVLERLGVGYARCAQENPGLVWCSISGYGGDGPLSARAGHDLNYLAAGGLLALSGERDGAPGQAAGQIADLGGGALMALVGIFAALRERDGGGGQAGSGRGQQVDIAMFDGALSWLALPAARYLATGVAQRRGELELAGGLVCYRPYRCADGYVALGALEEKFWRAFCVGIGREDLLPHQFDPPGSEAHGRLEEIFLARTRAQWELFAAEHDCCLEVVRELDEALASEQVAAREMVVKVDQPGASAPVRALGIPIKLSRTPGHHDRLPAPAPGQHTRELLTQAGYTEQQIELLIAEGALGEPEQGRSEST